MKLQNANLKWTGFDGGNNIQDFNGQTVALRGDPNFTVPKVCWIDASKPIKLNKIFDWVLSIEVGEHIPKKSESAFLDNLANHNREGVILSWAVRGQRGHGHVNEQSNDYIVSQMAKRNLTYDSEQSKEFRNSVTECSWLRNTIMVFRRTGNESGLTVPRQ